jgi:hypothetical protein
MENESNSMVKRSLLLTAKLVGAFALWVTVLSFVLVGLTTRMVGALSGASSATATSEDAPATKGQPGTPRQSPKPAPGVNAAKSNG